MQAERTNTTMNKVSLRFYKDHKVRAVWDEKLGMWWFSVLDVVGAINEQDDYKKTRNYWKYLKTKLKNEGNEVSFPKFSRQFLTYFPKIIDTRPKIVDTFLKTLTIILNWLTLPVDSLSIVVVEDRTVRAPVMASCSRYSYADVYRCKR